MQNIDEETEMVTSKKKNRRLWDDNELENYAQVKNPPVRSLTPATAPFASNGDGLTVLSDSSSSSLRITDDSESPPEDAAPILPFVDSVDSPPTEPVPPNPETVPAMPNVR
jgi:hypothetical protein